MYGYEGIWSFDPSPWVVEAVPTAAMRAGDFSRLLAVDRTRYQIYDPLLDPAGGQWTIQPPAGAEQHHSRQPHQPGGAENRHSVGRSESSRHGRRNQQLHRRARTRRTRTGTTSSASTTTYRTKQRFYVRTNFTDLQRPENIRHNNAVGDNFYRYNKGFAIDHVYTLSPRMFLNTRYTLTRFITGYTPYQQGWDLAGLGFSSEFINQINAVDPRYLKLPNISVSGYASLGGVNHSNNTPTDIHEAAVNVTTVAGSHTLRYGFAYRIYRRNNFNLGNSSGSLNFDTTWTRGPLDNSPRRLRRSDRVSPLFFTDCPERQLPDQRLLRGAVHRSGAVSPERLEGEPEADAEPRPSL